MFEFRHVKNSMYPQGKIVYKCPNCGRENAFFFTQPETVCLICGESFPDMKGILEGTDAAINYHIGKKEELNE